jgi:hypothetical protein
VFAAEAALFLFAARLALSVFQTGARRSMTMPAAVAAAGRG